MSGELQYISDTILIEKLARLEDEMVKQANFGDLAGQIFSGVSSAVSSFVKSNIDTASTGSTVKSVLGLLVPGMLFKVHPLLAFLYYIAKEYGYDIQGIVSDITSKVSDKLKSGEKVSPEEVNQAALSSTASKNNDLLSPLRELEKTGSLIKTAKGGRPVGGKFFGQKGAPILHNLFGFLPKSTGHSLLAGMIAWFVKTILLSAGLLAIGGGAKKLVETGTVAVKDKYNEFQDNEPNTNQGSNNAIQVDTVPSNQYIWYVPILGGTVKNTILEWAKEFYPDLSGYEDIILKTPAFNNTVNEMQKYTKGPYLVLPNNFKSREEIAKKFVPDIQNEIKRLSNENA